MRNWIKLIAATTAMVMPATAVLASDGSVAAPQPAFKTYPARPQAPAQAPNILIVLTDDVGFGASSTFGGTHSHAKLRRTGGAGCSIQ
ncbi:hypothetical protein [Sphingobium xenophagum]